MNNKVILVGANNYNGLGLVRSFGRNNIKPYGIIVGEDVKHGYVEKSKYWEYVWHVDHAEDVIPCLIEYFSEENQKPVVISYVDKVTQLIDHQYDTLCKLFILPSFNQLSNRIKELSSKKSQEEFARMHGIKMLDTKIISFPSDNLCDECLKFPIILKPVAGGEGDKHDIKICTNEESYINALKYFQDSGYLRILRQPYMRERKEYVVFGSISAEKNFVSYTVIENIRQWPNGFGVGCFSRYIVNGRVVEFAESILHKLCELGYDSPIDIEIFEDRNGDLYVNEFNWRVGGRNFTSLDTHVYSVVYWYMLKTDTQANIKENIINTKEGFSMKETEDFKNVVTRRVKILQWLRDIFRTSSFAVYDIQDYKPMLFYVIDFLKRIINKNI